MAVSLGLGIGLQGKPDLHLGIVKARQAGEQAYKAKKAKEDEALKSKWEQYFTKEITGKPYLPVDEGRVMNKAYGFLDNMMQTTDMGANMATLGKIRYDTLTDASKAAQRRKDFERIAQNPKQYGVAPIDIEIMMSESDPDVIERRLTNEGSDAISYNKATGEIIYDLIPNYKPVTNQFEDFVKVYGDYIFNTTKKPDVSYDIAGNKFMHGHINQDSKALFLQNSLSGERLRSLQRDFNSDPTNRAKGLRADASTPEGMEMLKGYASSVFDIGANSLLNEKRVREPGKWEVNVNTGEENNDMTSVYRGISKLNLYSDIARPDGGKGYMTTSQGSYGLPEVESTMAVPYGMRNSKNRKQITAPRGTFKGGEIHIVPVAKKSIKGKYRGQDVEIFKGEEVPDEFIGFALKETGVEYVPMVMGEFKGTNDRNWQPVSYPARTTSQMSFVKASKDDAATIQKNVLELNEIAKKANSFPTDFIQDLYGKYDGNLIENIEEIRGALVVPGGTNKDGSQKPAKVTEAEKLKL